MNIERHTQNWRIFANHSYLFKDPSEQRALFERLQNQWENQSLEEENVLHSSRGKNRGSVPSFIALSCKSGAERLILASAPWPDFLDYWKELKKWLAFDSHRQLIFLEWRIEDLARALSDQNGLKWLHHERVSLHYCNAIHGDIALQLLASEVAHNRCELQILAHEVHWRNYLRALWTRAGQIRGICDEVLKVPDTAAFCLRNGPHQAADLDLLHLRGALRDVPAILCGAGPSLDSQLAALATCRSHSLIIGCGSGALALQRARIRPHAVSAICPLRASFERWQQLDTLTTPALSCLRLFPGVDQLMAGPRIHLTGLSSAASTLWVEKSLGFEHGELSYGNSVLTATLRACFLMGCNPIYLAGVDLCYGPAGHKYAAGIDQIRAKGMGSDLLAPLIAPGVQGPVMTNWSWLTEKGYLGEMIAANPDHVVKRCGSRGLEIAGLGQGSLKRWSKKGVSRDLDNLLWSQLANRFTEPLPWQPHYASLRASLIRCLDHFCQKQAALASIPPWKRSADCEFVWNYLASLEFVRGQELAYDVLFRPIGEALEHLEYDQMRLDLKRFGDEPNLINRLLLQHADNRLRLFAKKGNGFLKILERQLA